MGGGCCVMRAGLVSLAAGGVLMLLEVLFVAVFAISLTRLQQAKAVGSQRLRLRRRVWLTLLTSLSLVLLLTRYFFYGAWILAVKDQVDARLMAVGFTFSLLLGLGVVARKVGRRVQDAGSHQ